MWSRPAAPRKGGTNVDFKIDDFKIEPLDDVDAAVVNDGSGGIGVQA